MLATKTVKLSSRILVSSEPLIVAGIGTADGAAVAAGSFGLSDERATVDGEIGLGIGLGTIGVGATGVATAGADIGGKSALGCGAGFVAVAQPDASAMTSPQSGAPAG